MPAQPSRECTIAVGATASSVFGTGQGTRGSFYLPSSFTGTTATVQGSIDGTTFTAVPLEGAETTTVAANNTYAFPVKAFNFPFLRLAVASQIGGTTRTVPIFTRD